MNGPLPPEVVSTFLARCRAERAAAGLPEKITDPVVIDRIARLVAGASSTPDATPARRARTNRTTPVDD